MLPRRLQAVVNMVPPAAVAVDIGSDHALVPIHLIKEGKVRRAVAVEKTEGPWYRSLQAVKKAGLADKIAVRLGDGLNALTAAEAGAVVIMAGIGGETIASICRSRDVKLSQLQAVVTQPMGREAEVRKSLCRRGLQISREDLVREDNRLYQVIAFTPGAGKYLNDPLLLELGPLLLAEGHPLLYMHLQKALSRRRIRAAGLKKSGKRQDYLLLLEQEIRRLEGMLHELEAANGNQLDG